MNSNNLFRFDLTEESNFVRGCFNEGFLTSARDLQDNQSKSAPQETGYLPGQAQDQPNVHLGLPAESAWSSVLH